MAYIIFCRRKTKINIGTVFEGIFDQPSNYLVVGAIFSLILVMWALLRDKYSFSGIACRVVGSCFNQGMLENVKPDSPVALTLINFFCIYNYIICVMYLG